MASVSSTSSANQYGEQQLQLLQARRNAEQAERVAQTLKAQAGDAQRVADKAQEDARSLSVQSDLAQVRAGQARQGLTALSSAQQAITSLGNIADRVVARQQESEAVAQVSPAVPVSAAPAVPVSNTTSTVAVVPAPVVNAQGQVIGKIINSTA